MLRALEKSDQTKHSHYKGVYQDKLGVPEENEMIFLIFDIKSLFTDVSPVQTVKLNGEKRVLRRISKELP